MKLMPATNGVEFRLSAIDYRYSQRTPAQPVANGTEIVGEVELEQSVVGAAPLRGPKAKGNYRPVHSIAAVITVPTSTASTAPVVTT